MLIRSVLLSIVLLSISLLSGCMVFEPLQTMSQETLRSLRPRTSDYRDPADEAIDEWSDVGREARGDQPMTKGGDPLYSSKARNIERNLGVGL